MDTAALPACRLAAAGDGLLEAGLGVADHKLHARQPPFQQSPQEGGPEGLVLTAGGHDHGPGDHLPAGRIQAVQVRRIEVEVGIAVLQRPVQGVLHLGVEPLADAATSDLEIPLSQPNTETSPSTLGVETPET
jgi:hypothetical protein